MVRWSPDGRYIAAVDSSSGGVGVWAAGTGELVATVGGEGSQGRSWSTAYDAVFSPDSDHLLLTTISGHLVEVETRTWGVTRARLLDIGNYGWAGTVGYATDGSLVVVNPLGQNAADTSVLLVDPQTLSLRRVWSEVAEGTVQSAALSPDGSRIALATEGGVVNVWDLATGRLVDQAAPGLGSLAGAQWLDDTSLVLMSATGHLTTVTSDADRLLALARSTLTRGPSQGECATYGIDPCPSLAALRGADPVVPEDLRGRFLLEWTPEQLLAAAVDRAEAAFGELDEASVDRLAEQTGLLAGSYLLELRESDYTITRGDAGEVWCTGAVSAAPGRAGRLLLGADSGSGCTDFHYAELGWELHGDQLTLPREQFRGSYSDTVLWTGKPLERVG